MGKGKGAVDYWAARVKPGRIMFEIDGVSEEIAREALRLGAAKLLGQDALRAAHRGIGRVETMKASDVRAKTQDQLNDELGEPEEGAVQPALPEGDRPAREDRARA